MSRLEVCLLKESELLEYRLALCKTTHLRYQMKESHKDFLREQAVIGIYASWEGFVKKSLSLYLDELNGLELSVEDVHPSYLAYHANSVIDFANPRKNHDSVIKAVNILISQLRSPLNLKANINLGSSPELKVINKLLSALCLEELDGSYAKKLKVNISLRHMLAHGDEAGYVSDTRIEEFSFLIYKLGCDICSSVISGFQNKVYLE